MVVSDACGLRQHVTRLWTRYRAVLIALGITLFGAGLRLYDIGANSFTHDEAWAIWLTEHDLPFVMRTTALGGADPSTPPPLLCAHALFFSDGTAPTRDPFCFRARRNTDGVCHVPAGCGSVR